MRAVFVGGPANGMELDVRGVEAYVAVLDGRAVEVPDTPDEALLNRAAGAWSLYVAATGDTTGTVRFDWVQGASRSGSSRTA